jgi:hypothetical protein
MLRLPRRWTLNTFRSPFYASYRYLGPSSRHSYRYPSPSFRHVHTDEAPYSGPPSYETINRRFSSHPNPYSFFIRQSQQEAIDRGQFVDIHAIDGPDPNSYDVLIKDVDEKILRSDIAKIVGVPYLGEDTESDVNTKVEVGHGFIFGRNLRTIFPCTVGRGKMARWIFFIVDPGSPITYLSLQVCVYICERNA